MWLQKLTTQFAMNLMKNKTISFSFVNDITIWQFAKKKEEIFMYSQTETGWKETKVWKSSNHPDIVQCQTLNA